MKLVATILFVLVAVVGNSSAFTTASGCARKATAFIFSRGHSSSSFWNYRSSSQTATPRRTLPRRDFLAASIGFSPGLMIPQGGIAAAESSSTMEPIADLPMVRLSLPKHSLGREYVAIPLKIQDQGPFYFMVDSGLTTELMTPHLLQILEKNGKKKSFPSSIQGLAAGGSTRSNPVVPLKGAALCCAQDGSGDSLFTLPTLTAVITDFPQEHIDPAHDPVEGMLGMEVLSLFDCDFDFPKQRLRFYRPGDGQNVFSSSTKKMVEIPAVVINETGLIGIRVRSVTGQKQPILGFLDCGSSFSAMNWEAAKYFGLPPKGDPAYRKVPYVTAVGVDGRPLQLPLMRQQISFTGDTVVDPQTGKPSGFEEPPKEWKDWDPVNVAVGDIPAFSSILGDGITPFQGPAMLIGLDILAQRRFILETGKDNDRRRRLLVEAN